MGAWTAFGVKSSAAVAGWGGRPRDARPPPAPPAPPQPAATRRTTSRQSSGRADAAGTAPQNGTAARRRARPASAAGGGAPGGAGAPVGAPDEHGDGQHGEAEKRVGQRVGRGAVGAVEGVAGERERRRPDAGAQQAPGQEGAQPHTGGADEERGDRADEADEPAGQDGLRAVAGEERL